MRTKLLCVMVALAMVLVVGNLVAQTPTDCLYQAGSGSLALKAAVASNYYEAAKQMVGGNPAGGYPGGWLGQYGPANATVTICHNSTAILEQEIKTQNYDILFAADNTAENFEVTIPDYPAFTYAKGIPVIFALNSKIADVSGLIFGLPSPYGTSATIADGPSTIGQYDVASGLVSRSASVTVAGPGAPYGRASHNILNDMYNNTDLPTNPPSWIYTPLWTNIDDTFKAVTTGTVPDIWAGFVGKSQICAGIPTSDYTFVEFIDDAYALEQAVALTSTNTLAQDLYDYIQDEMAAGDWEAFLAGNCYRQP